MNWFKIDEVSQKTGLTKRALRYYEDIGLIQPPERSDGKFRLYSEEDIEQIQNIILAKEVLGFSLQELQEFLTFKSKIQKQIHQLHHLNPEELQQMSQVLQKQIHMLDIKMERIKKYKSKIEILLGKVQQTLDK